MVGDHKVMPHLYQFVTQEEFLEALRARREFVIKNNPKNMLKRQVEIDEAKVCSQGICDGSGKVSKIIQDSDTHEWIVDGEEDCLCVKLERHQY